jgi:hypothetical protein
MHRLPLLVLVFGLASISCGSDSNDRASGAGGSSSGGGSGSGGSSAGGSGGVTGGSGGTSGAGGGACTDCPWQLAPGHFEPAKLPLAIIAPEAGIGDESRYSKAYPGIEYRVPIVVLGGAWPFRYELVTAPSGMSIGQTHGSNDYGIVSWPSPAAGDHPVSVKVTDQEGATSTVDFGIAVTESGFLFVDAVNGSDSNPGTLAAPMKTMAGWFGTDKYDDTHAGAFVYYRTGTYRTDAAPIEDGIRIALTGKTKPVVHLAYPGEKPVFDVRNAHIALYGGNSDLYFQGLTWDHVFDNNAYKGVAIESNTPRVIVFENVFLKATDEAPIGSNGTMLFAANGEEFGEHWAIVNNEFADLTNGGAFEVYSVSDSVFEGNTLAHNAGGGLYLKNAGVRWTVRNNRGSADNSNFLFRSDAYNGLTAVHDVEVCWNNYASSGTGWELGYEAKDYGTHWVYRNTWQVGHHRILNATAGSVLLTRDVVQHDGQYENGILLENTTIVPEVEDLLVGTSGLVDANGTLTSAHAASAGTHGHTPE